jgi:hypothetical protein
MILLKMQSFTRKLWTMSEKDFNYVSAADEHSDNIARVK